jgi:hypothetical protein
METNGLAAKEEDTRWNTALRVYIQELKIIDSLRPLLIEDSNCGDKPGQERNPSMLNAQLANHTGPSFSINEFKLQFDDGQEVINRVLDLTKEGNLQIVVAFQGLPEEIQRFRVVADIRKTENETGISGDFSIGRRATTIEAIVDLESEASRLTVEVEHDHPEINEDQIPDAVPFDSILPPFHLGPGIYDLVAEFTPMDESGLREDLKVSLSYNFNGVVPASSQEGSPAAFENTRQPDTTTDSLGSAQ